MGALLHRTAPATGGRSAGFGRQTTTAVDGPSGAMAAAAPGQATAASRAWQALRMKPREITSDPRQAGAEAAAAGTVLWIAWSERLGVSCNCSADGGRVVSAPARPQPCERAAGTTRTGHCAARTTPSVTLPSRARYSAPCPCDPMTITSARSRAPSAMIFSTVEP